MSAGDPEARRLAGEILRLLEKGDSGRTRAEEERLAELSTTFGDHLESGIATIRAARKNSPAALRMLRALSNKEK